MLPGVRRLLVLALVVLPQRAKHVVARRLLGWDIHPTAHLGRSIVDVRHLSMGPESMIGPFYVIRSLDRLELGRGANIASRNWIVGVPLDSAIYARATERDPSLVMGEFAMITVGHDIDCADRVELADHAVIAGFRSSVLTHSLNFVNDRFVTGAITLGPYAVLLSNCVMLTGTNVPARSIVSAGSVVTTPLSAEQTFYRGNPAEPVRELPDSLRFFEREGRQAQMADEVARWAELVSPSARRLRTRRSARSPR
jgi:acetyltransferase-like isoleucine patch superfamily enzyme